MTLAPLVRPDIRGHKGKPVELPPRCVVPGCLSLVRQRHHLWPKSFLRGQPYEWVEIGERVLANSVGLCVRHHHEVTSPVGGHVAHIRWNERLAVFEWWENDEDRIWTCRGPLRGQALIEPEPEVHRVRRQEGLCPTCGHVVDKPPRLKREKTSLPPRKTKTWTILVPDDAEIGADVLDTYCEDLAVLLGFDTSSQRLLRYHVLAVALTWVNINKTQFVTDIEEAAAA
jgi:hypothetical protein